MAGGIKEERKEVTKKASLDDDDDEELLLSLPIRGSAENTGSRITSGEVAASAVSKWVLIILPMAPIDKLLILKSSTN